MHAWQSGAHQLGGAAGVAGGALDAVGLEDESSDGGGGVATALPGRRRSALSESNNCKRNTFFNGRFIEILKSRKMVSV